MSDSSVSEPSGGTCVSLINVLTKTDAGQTCAAVWSSDRKWWMAIRGKVFQRLVQPPQTWHFVRILSKPRLFCLLTRVSCASVRGSSVVRTCHHTLRGHTHLLLLVTLLKLQGNSFPPKMRLPWKFVVAKSRQKLWFHHLSTPVVFAHWLIE